MRAKCCDGVGSNLSYLGAVMMTMRCGRRRGLGDAEDRTRGRELPAGTRHALAGSGTGRCGPATHEARDLLFVSAWCGLAAGLLEVGNEGPLPGDRSQPAALRHEPALHLVGPALEPRLLPGDRPPVGGRRQARAACDRLDRPSVDLRLHHVARAHGGGPSDLPSAWLLVALGISVGLVPTIERHGSALRSRLPWSFPFMMGLVLALAGSVLVGDRLKRRESRAVPCRRPIRPTSSSSCWTRCGPTASAFTAMNARPLRISNDSRSEEFASIVPGRPHPGPWLRTRACSPADWPHELGAEWMTPLRGNLPMLAEYLGAHGYATAGFVANVLYCSQKPGWPAASLITKTMSWKNSHRCGPPAWSNAPPR